MASAADNDLDWASSAASSPVVGKGAMPSDSNRMFSEEFFEDFDDDDEAFFSSATGRGAADPNAGASLGEGLNYKTTSQSDAAPFGMMALTYNDSALSRGGNPRAPSPTFGQAADDSLVGDDNISDDAELMELDRRHLVHLRNPSSPLQIVAKSCLVLHQMVYSTDQGSSSGSKPSIQIESSSIYHVQRYQRLIHRILSSLTTCITSHNLSSCRSLACRALATTARSSYARLRFDARLTSVSLPPSIATRLEDECGNGSAYTLVIAAIEQGDDSVSSAALEALGILTLDSHTDNLSAEVRGIAESASTNMFISENDSNIYWILEHSFVMKEMQAKAWEHVIFPRMQNILHRIRLYTSPHLLARAIPLITATFAHALMHGHDTMPSRRAFQTNKASHAKRGWREVDAEGLAREYVEGVLLPCLSDRGPFDSKQCRQSLNRSIAASLIRMSCTSPYAPWRLLACRGATTTLLQQLTNEMSLESSPTHVSWNSIAKQRTNGIDGAQTGYLPIFYIIKDASVPIETLAGTAAMLIVALRGIPLHERAPGLSAVLRATLLYLPMGISCEDGAFDLPVYMARVDRHDGNYRLGRTGLLTEVALSIMLDGATTTTQVVHESIGEDGNKQMMTGARSVLLQRILNYDQLSGVLEGSKDRHADYHHYHPMDEIVWVFCSVATRAGSNREQLFARDSSSVIEWSSISLVLLDFFATAVCNPRPKSGSPFQEASHDAYRGLFSAVLRLCGSSPPPALSISENMLLNFPGSGSVEGTSAVVGGPGKRHHYLASSLSKVATKILFLRDTSKNVTTQIGGDSMKASSNIVPLAALLVDAWLGRCIMNHDTKQPNDEQLEVGLQYLPLCHSEVELLIHKNRSDENENNVALAGQSCRILIACLEHIACMSVLLPGGRAAAPEKQVCSLVISMLKEIIKTAKEGRSTDTKQGSLMRYQIALDSNNAISWITECLHTTPQSSPDDLVSEFRVSSLFTTGNPMPRRSSDVNEKPVGLCARFLYHHARLALVHRTEVASKSVAPTAYSVGVLASSKLIQPRNPLRIPNAFTYSNIEMYRKAHDLPLLVPAQRSTDSSWETATLTGCSDPVSLIMSHGIRRVRKSDSSEDISDVVTMRLYNITPTPIRHGIRLDLRATQEIVPSSSGVFDCGSTCVATSVYKHEIKAGDYVTWEVVLHNVRAGNTSLQAFVTFRELEQEPSTQTYKWVSGGGLEEEQPLSTEAMDGDDESTSDFTLACRQINLSPIKSLQPCPLVFFGGLSPCDSSLGCGDTDSFEFLWKGMENCERRIPFISNTQIDENTVMTHAGFQKGYVVLSTADKPVTGCAFVAPSGNRILCVHQTANLNDILCVRSDSSCLIESLTGSPSSQSLLLRFVFEDNARRIEEMDRRAPPRREPSHDFPSMTMSPSASHDFPSMNMPHRRPILS